MLQKIAVFCRELKEATKDLNCVIIMMAKCIKKVVLYEDLSEKEAYDCMMQIISGNASNIQIAALLTALSMKGETVDEITGFVKAMRKVSIEVSPDINAPLVDTCGTGGDKLKTFNVSTISAIIAASCGVASCKTWKQKYNK